MKLSNFQPSSNEISHNEPSSTTAKMTTAKTTTATPESKPTDPDDFSLPSFEDAFDDSSLELESSEPKSSTQMNGKGSGREYITSFTTTSTTKPDIKKGVEVIKNLVGHTKATSAPNSAIQSLTTMRSNRLINTFSPFGDSADGQDTKLMFDETLTSKPTKNR